MEFPWGRGGEKADPEDEGQTGGWARPLFQAGALLDARVGSPGLVQGRVGREAAAHA